jgi:hypothetical protein
VHKCEKVIIIPSTTQIIIVSQKYLSNKRIKRGPKRAHIPYCLSFHLKHLLTRCVIHNGLAINLISTIDIYDKLVVARGKIKKKSILMYIKLL